MTEPPTPTPGSKEECTEKKRWMAWTPPSTSGTGERKPQQERVTADWNLPLVLLIVTLVNTGLLCIILGVLIGHR